MAYKRQKEIRERRTLCGENYMHVGLYPLYPTARGPRPERRNESTIIQKNLNDKNSRRLFYEKALTNFGPQDCMLTLTYSDAYLPATREQAEREVNNFLRRVRDHMKRQGCGPLKYMLVTECTLRKSGRHKGSLHIHHHILISGGLGAEQLANLWRRPPRKGQKQGELIGFPNVKPLLFNENGIEGLMVYFFGPEKTAAQKEIGIEREKHRRRWRGSKNLAEPKRPRPNDTKWSNRRVAALAQHMHDTGEADPEFWQRKYPGWHFSSARPEYNEITGRWSIYLRMHRRI